MAVAAAASTSKHDLELVALAASGSRPAFGELVRRHGSAVRGLLRRMGADASLADDLAQDAFLTAYEQIGEFRGEGTFQGLGPQHRRPALRPALEAGPEARLPRRRRPSRRTDERGPTAGDRIDLDEGLRRLPEVERVCVSLCYGAGFTHAEAASALNLPLGTVKSHVKRGLDKLRARLAPRGSGEAGIHG